MATVGANDTHTQWQAMWAQVENGRGDTERYARLVGVQRRGLGRGGGPVTTWLDGSDKRAAGAGTGRRWIGEGGRVGTRVRIMAT
jgi:hypothetical protein